MIPIRFSPRATTVSFEIFTEFACGDDKFIVGAGLNAIKAKYNITPANSIFNVLSKGCFRIN